MDALLKSDEWKQGFDETQKLLSDPEAMAALQKQVGVMNTDEGVSYAHECQDQ